LKLKEDEDGNKITKVRGIRAVCKVVKTRYAKPFEKVEIKIPYDTGMNPCSGLVNLFENEGLLTKKGNRLAFVDKTTGEETLNYRKVWERNEDGCLNVVMKYFENIVDEYEEEDEDDMDEDMENDE